VRLNTTLQSHRPHSDRRCVSVSDIKRCLDVPQSDNFKSDIVAKTKPKKLMYQALVQSTLLYNTVQWVPGVLSLGLKARPGHDADHSPPSSAEVENE
jgi:hypothetical protein